MDKPQLFICHSSKDKERFVEGLATALRQNGVEPWYDDWELKLGDSLTNRILGDLSEDGAIAESDYFLVVVSEHSIESDWVQEELGRGLVSNIAGDTQVLPLILDLEPDEVPPVLDNTLWHRVEDPAEPDEAVNKVLAAIFNKSVKPDAGEPPAYARSLQLEIPGLQKSTPACSSRSTTTFMNSARNGARNQVLLGLIRKWFRDFSMRDCRRTKSPTLSRSWKGKLYSNTRRLWPLLVSSRSDRFNRLIWG